MGCAMRAAIAVLLMWAGVAWGQTWVAPNKAGGRIVLTSTPCQWQKNMLAMYSEAANQDLLLGCWTWSAGRVLVVYTNGTTRSYDPSGFSEYREPGEREQTRRNAL